MDSNHRHSDFQSLALPTELSGRQRKSEKRTLYASPMDWNVIVKSFSRVQSYWAINLKYIKFLGCGFLIPLIQRHKGALGRASI